MDDFELKQGPLNFYKHHLGDYDGATSHLSWDEDMAYTRLLRACYRTEKPINPEQAHRLCRAHSKAQRAAVDAVLKEFFELRDDGWHNKRADAETKAYQDQASTNRRIARERSGKRTVDEPFDASCDICQQVFNDVPDASSAKLTPNQELEPGAKNQGNPEPSWLPPEWAEFEQHRREKRATLTPTARRRCIDKLDAWRREGKDIGAILRYTIEQGYTGIVEPRGNGKAGVTAGNLASTNEWLKRGQNDEE